MILRLLLNRLSYANVVATAAIVLAAGGGVVWAAGTFNPVDSAGVVHGCYNSNTGDALPPMASLLLVNSADPCPDGYTALNFNVKGEAGSQGPAGPQGSPGTLAQNTPATIASKLPPPIPSLIAGAGLASSKPLPKLDDVIRVNINGHITFVSPALAHRGKITAKRDGHGLTIVTVPFHAMSCFATAGITGGPNIVPDAYDRKVDKTVQSNLSDVPTGFDPSHNPTDGLPIAAVGVMDREESDHPKTTRFFVTGDIWEKFAVLWGDAAVPAAAYDIPFTLAINCS
jgi:hypothetical protein